MKYYLMGIIFFGLGVAYSLIDNPLLGKPPSDFGIGKAVIWIMPAIMIALVSNGLASGSLATRYGIRISASNNLIFFIFANSFYLAIGCFLFWVARYVPSH